MSFPGQEMILKEVVLKLAISMNANTENSQIKHCPCSKYLKVRIFWQIRESLEPRKISFHEI